MVKAFNITIVLLPRSAAELRRFLHRNKLHRIYFCELHFVSISNCCFDDSCLQNQNVEAKLCFTIITTKNEVLIKNKKLFLLLNKSTGSRVKKNYLLSN